MTLQAYVLWLQEIIKLLLFVGARVSDTCPLPSISDKVKKYLAEDNAFPIWRQLIQESADYYFTSFPGISSSQEYQAIGRKMFAAYPSIKRDGENPWVSIFTLCELPNFKGCITFSFQQI